MKALIFLVVIGVTLLIAAACDSDIRAAEDAATSPPEPFDFAEVLPAFTPPYGGPGPGGSGEAPRRICKWDECDGPPAFNEPESQPVRE